jgi:AcrR family transcriptional regulator
MARRRGEIGARRREQIIEAAVAVIAEQGIQKLSLSSIEERTGMSRGQLTYYFRTKEDILLAVFDHMIETMRRAKESGKGPGDCAIRGEGWERHQALLSLFILAPPEAPEFHALQYTFLSQIGHRDDFRQRLASLYELWRGMGAADFALDLKEPPKGPPVSPRTLSSFVQALLHGLAMQRVADPAAYDPREMLTLTLHLLGNYLSKDPKTPDEPPHKPTPERRRRSRKKEGD